MTIPENLSLPTRKLLIGGDWKSATGEERIESINPASGQAFTEIESATEADVDQAVKTARATFENLAWRRMRPLDREN